MALLVIGGSAAFLRGRRAQAGATGAARSSDVVAASMDGDEVRQLRAELQTKDRLIRELVAQNVDKDAKNANLAAATVAAANRPTDREAALAHARQVLDERLAAPSAGSVAELEHAMAATLEPGAQSTARIAARRCNGAMCRVTLTADSPAAMNATIEAMMDHLPKVFGGSAVYDEEDGTRAIYLARSSDDLAIAAPND